MPELDRLAPNYARARNRWPTASTLCSAYDALITTYSSNAYGLVEHVRSFIECVCRTVLDEYGASLSSDSPTTTELLVEALGRLGFRNEKGASKLDKVLSAYNRLTDALSEMRNHHGPVAHGKDAFLDAISADHARAFLFTGDAILGVLLGALEGKEPDLTLTRQPYESFALHNRRIDEAVHLDAEVEYVHDEVVVVVRVSVGDEDPVELSIEPSRLLYGVDRGVYVEVLRQSASAEVSSIDTLDESSELTPVPLPTTPTLERESLLRFVADYTGRLSEVRSEIETLLRDLGIEVVPAEAGEASLVESLLATLDASLGVDWQSRSAVQAESRVNARRVLRKFGISAGDAAAVSNRLLELLLAKETMVG